MRKFGKWAFLALAPLLAAGVVAGTAFADFERGSGFQHMRFAHWRGQGGWEHGGPLTRLRESLQLTDEQVEKIRNILTEARKKAIRVAADLQVARIELRQLLTETDVDKGKVEAKINLIGQIGQQLLRHRTDTLLQVREVLTPEQRKKAQPFFMRWFSSGPRGPRSQPM